METKTITDLGTLIHKHDVDIKFSSGSGGFCAVLKHRLSGKEYSGYSWVISEAMETAYKNLEQDLGISRDEDTKPGIKPDGRYKAKPAPETLRPPKGK